MVRIFVLSVSQVGVAWRLFPPEGEISDADIIVRMKGPWTDISAADARGKNNDAPQTIHQFCCTRDVVFVSQESSTHGGVFFAFLPNKLGVYV
ncbi:hypothetical protein TNIN_353311 [Trichonephila inaurata madagascariensis]|uniref:Uncharacterized protein n=1 Tax=Trichonephila inaurata madagascariensis TaxID=2747483 RepID=A0A8X6X6A6_9ARAC|nr:hypothetical protein TNIN_353311 [Trichonephila inaurata madagascariensis]